MTETLSLHPLFCDHAVLPRDVPLHIFGKAVPGQKIKVGFGGSHAVAQTDDSGFWEVQFEPFPAGGPFILSVSTSGSQLIRRDILMGDVWLASGGANMELPLSGTEKAGEAIANSTHPRVRLFSAERCAAAEPLRENNGKWMECTPRTAADFSAIGYYFGHLLNDALDVPIGIIDASWGPVSATSWIPASFIKSQVELADFARPLVEDSKKVNTPLEQFPGGLFNGMIAPFARCRIKGVIWYQGERDVKRAHLYRHMFRALVDGWRDAFGRHDLPFLFSQLANFSNRNSAPVEDAWAEMRESQAIVGKLPFVGMVVTADTGEADSITPKNKLTVAERFVLKALAIAYGFDVVHSGPEYAGEEFENGTIRIRFTNAESGLRVIGRGGISGFSIAGDDRLFRWADVRIDGSCVIVSHPNVPVPVAVRYAWDANPPLRLFSGDGLPVAPFRTDSWPGITEVGNRIFEERAV